MLSHSLLFICYNIKLDEKKHLKPIIAEMLVDKIREHPKAVVVTPEIAAAATATAAAAVTISAAAIDVVVPDEVPIVTNEVVEGSDLDFNF